MKRIIMYSSCELADRRPGLSARLFNNVLLWLKRDRQRCAPGTISNHMLKDIGLSRAELDLGITKQPWHE